MTLDPVTGQLREGLARSVAYSPDGTTLTFKLRRGLHFNDGSKLGPKDIDFSFHLLYATSTASYVRSPLHGDDRLWQETNCYVDLEFTEACPGFWGIEFPKAETALASANVTRSFSSTCTLISRKNSSTNSCLVSRIYRSECHRVLWRRR